MMQKMSWLITREPFQLATNMEKVLNMNFKKKKVLMRLNFSLKVLIYSVI